ncbi:MAG: hypothetical protein AAF639_35595 [Chloroflexota bacterium]
MHLTAESSAKQDTSRIFAQVHQLIAPLTSDERLSLIRDILAVPPLCPPVWHTVPSVEDSQSKTKASGDATNVSQSDKSRTRQIRRQKLKEEQMAWYARTQEERDEYAGQYVALHAGGVVDSDVDRQVLHQRVRQQFGREPIPIIPAEQDELPTLVFRSPKLG